MHGSLHTGLGNQSEHYQAWLHVRFGSDGSVGAGRWLHGQHVHGGCNGDVRWVVSE